MFVQAEEFSNIIVNFDSTPEVNVSLGGAVAADILCGKSFAGIMLEVLSPVNLAVFTENLMIAIMVIRELRMPDGKISKELFHGCMCNDAIVPKNVCTQLLYVKFCNFI